MNPNSILFYFYIVNRKLWQKFKCFIAHFFTSILFYLNHIKHGSFVTINIPYININRHGGKIIIGNNFKMNNYLAGNPIGYDAPCCFVAGKDATIKIGDNVGISQTALIAIADITICNNVKIGGGTKIYTSDFHSLNWEVRRTTTDREQRKSAPVIIGQDAFIGAGCIILKGVSIGERSIIGAGSVVTKSIPADEIWAGNPVKFIKKLN